jgi:predicted metal-dependent hydrolase
VSDPIEIVRHPRARRVKLAVDPTTGRARLTLPKRAALAPAIAWAESQQAWLDAQRARLPQSRPFAPGACIPFAGQEVEIDWRAAALRTPRLDGGLLVVGGPREGLERRIERWLKREALRVLSEETSEFAALAGVVVDRVSVADPRTRWGSCSSTGAIRYSWRLILMPPEVRRATVAHEVAHRLHMNHGPAFHAAVAALFGKDPRPARRWLKANGAAMQRVGR